MNDAHDNNDIFFSYPVAAATLWNTLPVDVQSSPLLPVFRQRLKTFLFHKSFPDVV